MKAIKIFGMALTIASTSLAVSAQEAPEQAVMPAANQTEKCASQADFFGKTIDMRQAGMGLGQVYTFANQSYESAYREEPSEKRKAWTKDLLLKVYGDRDYLFVDSRQAANEYAGQCNMNPKGFLLME